MKLNELPYLAMALLLPVNVMAESQTATPAAPTHTPMVMSNDSSRGRYAGVEADNSAANRGDDSKRALSPLDQSNGPQEIRTTAQIRQALVDNSNLSLNAKNIKIITTANRIVTLRGVVKSEIERQQVEAIAARNAAGFSVKNELNTEK